MSSPDNGYTATSGIGACGINYIDSLLGGTRWGSDTGSGASLTYSFPWSGPPAWWTSDYSTLAEPSSGFGFDATQQAAARAVLASWSAVANIAFTEVADASTVGDIRMAWTTKTLLNSDGLTAPAWAYLPDGYWAAGGDIWFSEPGLVGQGESSWQTGGFCYYALIHELGHTLGLKHTFEGGTAALPDAVDSMQYSVMAYNYHPRSLFVRETPYSWESFYVMPDTPMLYDIAAIQYIYGANMSYRTGDDVYTFEPDKPFFRTLWDAGGNDTISVANFGRDCLIDLRAGQFSDIRVVSDYVSGAPTPAYDGTDNLAVAFGVTLENAIGGSGNDTLVGNDANNAFAGGAGADSIDGGPGSDAAKYFGPRGAYGIAHSGSGYRVTDLAGAEGSDALIGVETLQFADVTVDLTVQAAAASVSRPELDTLIELYIAYFNRVPDAGGLVHWLNQYRAGTPLDQIAQAFYDAGVVYGNFTGYSPDMPASDFVGLVYANVLGRGPAAGTAPPPDADIAYWVDRLASGAYDNGTLVTKMLSDAHVFKGDPSWGWVPNLLDNKVAVGYMFAVAHGLGYPDPNQAISQGTAIVEAVTPTDISAAVALIGIVDAPLTT